MFSPGEAMQIDWGECYVYLNGMRTKIYFFCARLCYSCAPFVVCYRRQNTESFLEALIRAFEFFGGVPRRVIFDNGKVAVKAAMGRRPFVRIDMRRLLHITVLKRYSVILLVAMKRDLWKNLVGWTRRNALFPSHMLKAWTN